MTRSEGASASAVARIASAGPWCRSSVCTSGTWAFRRRSAISSSAASAFTSSPSGQGVAWRTVTGRPAGDASSRTRSKARSAVSEKSVTQRIPSGNPRVDRSWRRPSRSTWRRSTGTEELSRTSRATLPMKASAIRLRLREPITMIEAPQAVAARRISEAGSPSRGSARISSSVPVPAPTAAPDAMVRARSS